MHRLAVVGIALGALAACGDFRRGANDAVDGGGGVDEMTPLGADAGADGADAGGADTSRDGQSAGEGDGGRDAATDGGAQTGPGPFGALPSGYCCTSDEDCRYRKCIDANGVKACADWCRFDFECQDGVVSFTCDSPNNVDPGWCRPGPTFTACAPADSFHTGTRAMGACCSPANGATAGVDCQSGLCTGINDGPMVCSRICKDQGDCPSGYSCGSLETDNGAMACFPPTAMPYTCQ